MKPLRPQLRGLIFKLAVFYVLLSLPCLVLVESAILIFEFDRFMGDIDRGALVRATDAAARDLAQAWPSAPGDEARGLATWTQAWVMRLQRPRGGLVAEPSYILVELAGDALGAAVLAPDGRLLALAPGDTAWKLELPPAAALAAAAATPQALPGADSPYRIRRVLAPITNADGTRRGFVLVELRLPVPWHRFVPGWSLEWPIVLGYLIVFGIASSLFLATWVTRRLDRVARAASAWSRGDFSDRIGDTSRDELGRLSRLLDAMALELRALMRSRAQLATLAERARLARDLHDTVKQRAFALSLQLAALRRQLGEHAAGERIAQAEHLSQQIQHELVQILDELRASDTELAFAERLRLRAQEWAQASGIALELDLSDVPVTPAAAEALLRIADEALANALRHSGARHVRVRLQHSADRAMLAIADDGRGATALARPGMGLANMRERAEALPRGTFEFTSAPGRGATVTITFALEAPTA